MNFSIDKQSLDELNLMGRFRSGSIYHLFNQVRTRRGEKLLDELFRDPLTDETVINKRSAIFLFFQQRKLDFPFDPEQVTAMQEYVDGAANGSLPVALVQAVGVEKSQLTHA